ncbi:MAG: T9SS type A sorting domain-containing protein, partial [Bacteroidota bacterium]
NGDYEFAVEAGWFDAMGIEYYFRGVDGSGNVGVSPDTTATTNKYHKTFVKYDGANLPKLDLIKGSTGASGYQIISVPLELSNKNIADNFEELGTADNTAFRFLRYHSQPSEGWDEYPGGGLSALARGEGYFLNSLNAEEITLLNGVAPAVDQSNLFELTLKPGWNQIGNPYTVQIQWKDVIAFNGTPTNVSTKLTKYDNGYNTTDPDGIIEPYKGGFVNVNGSSDVKLKVPFKGMTSGRTQRVGSDLSAQNWEMPFTITQGNISYNMGLIGMNEQASLSMDNFDLPMAPRLGEYVEATFDHPEHARKKFSQDVVPASDEFTWTFGVNSNLKGMAQLNWNNLGFGENEKELFLQDLGTEQVINMRQVASYAFDPARSSRFRIYFGDDLEKKISPARVTLTPTPNPATSKVQINFSLPDQGAEHFVKIEIYDLVGRKMGTLVNEKMNPGFYSAPWDATTAGEGMYVCRLAVITGENQAMITERIVIKK